MFVIEEELKKLPQKPGVYLMHDAQDNIIYVGKAIRLRSRVQSYFREKINRGPQIEKMVTQIARFEYIVTDSELEALVLENNLIKEHNPKYNTLLKDDKTYPYIKVTVGEAYPRVQFSRLMKKDKSKYFGPFTSAAAVTAAGLWVGTPVLKLSHRAVYGSVSGLCEPRGVPGTCGQGAGVFKRQL